MNILQFFLVVGIVTGTLFVPMRYLFQTAEGELTKRTLTVLSLGLPFTLGTMIALLWTPGVLPWTPSPTMSPELALLLVALFVYVLWVVSFSLLSLYVCFSRSYSSV